MLVAWLVGAGPAATRARLRPCCHAGGDGPAAANPGCRRVRLLVSPDNARARALYDRFGFRTIGQSDRTGELVLEAALPTPAEVDGLRTFLLLAVAARARRVFRHRRLRLTSGPHPAWVIGVERGPPATPRR